MLTLTHLPQKTRQFLKNSHKIQLTPHSFTIKNKGYFSNSTPTIGLRVFSSKITFILGRESSDLALVICVFKKKKEKKKRFSPGRTINHPIIYTARDTKELIIHST